MPIPSTEAETLTRRDALRTGADAVSRMLSAASLIAVPLALAAFSRSASAQTSTDVVDALKQLLFLERVQLGLHQRALAATGFVPAADSVAITVIRDQEQAHVDLLLLMLGDLGGTASDGLVFDWTANGAFPGFDFQAGQYETYKVIAQGIEDVGVRAYKTQAERMSANPAAMLEVLRIHTVEARHSAEIRLIRGIRPWITGSSRGDLPAYFQPVYDGEDLTVHDGVNSASVSTVSVAAVTEAFDEPLAADQVSAVLGPFVVKEINP